jgi:peptidyl-prolyl cis-trans isomerase B (cyclophilin B)
MMKNIVLISILAILLFGCVNEYTGATNTTTGTGQTTTSQTTGTTLPSNYTIQYGDHVWADYTLWVDGEIIDTSNATLASEAGIYSSRRSYGPIDFDVELGAGMIDGFILNVIAMRVNETITFSVPPEQGYGPYDPSKVMYVPRYYEQSLYEVAPVSYFEEQGVNLSNGSIVSSNPLVFVSDINDENVTLYYALSTGQTFYQGGLDYNVVNITDTTATLEVVLDINGTYVLPHPETGVSTQFTVINITDENIILDSNHFLANKTLTFKVTVTKIQHDGASIG